jgi:2-dehydropantoate 2-reductase
MTPSKKQARMKICVYGAGAIGGHLAARFAKAGADVSVVVRGAHLDAIRRDGLVVRTAEGELRPRLHASDDPAELGPQDCVLVTAKSSTLAAVAQSIAPLLKPETPVAFVMNGVPWWYFYRHGGALDDTRLPRLDPGDALRNAIGMQRVVGGVVNSPSEVVAPGVVNVERRNNSLIIGEPDGSASERTAAIARLLTAAGMEGVATQSIRDAIWNKLIGNLMTGPLSVLSQANYKRFLSEPACHDAARRIVHEAEAIAHALGCRTRSTAEERIAGVFNLPHRPSILQDLERGRPMEVEGIYVTAVELARMVNVPTPTLDLLVGLVKVRAAVAGLYG